MRRSGSIIRGLGTPRRHADARPEKRKLTYSSSSIDSRRHPFSGAAEDDASPVSNQDDRAGCPAAQPGPGRSQCRPPTRQNVIGRRQLIGLFGLGSAGGKAAQAILDAAVSVIEEKTPGAGGRRCGTPPTLPG